MPGDEDLGLLLRTWRETGSDVAESRYLAEAVRQNKIDKRALVLAAYCGRKAARKILGAKAPKSPGDPSKWLLGLLKVAGQPGWVRLAATLGWHHLSAWESLHPEEKGPRKALELVEQLLRQGHTKAPPKNFRQLFDLRNDYPYFMRDYGFNDKRAKLPQAAKDAVGVVVCACNLIDDPEGAEEWLEDLADSPFLPVAMEELSLWALGITRGA